MFFADKAVTVGAGHFSLCPKVDVSYLGHLRPTLKVGHSAASWNLALAAIDGRKRVFTVLQVSWLVLHRVVLQHLRLVQCVFTLKYR